MLVATGVPFIFFMFRGLIAGVVVGIVVMSFFMTPAARKRMVTFLVAGGAIGVVVAITLAGLVTQESLGDMFYTFFNVYLGDLFHLGESMSGELGQFDNTMSYRMWKAEYHLKVFWENPVFGIGYMSPWGSVAWELYQQGYMPLGDADSGWVDVLLRLGSVGAVFLAIFYSVVLRRMGKQISFTKRHSVVSLEEQSWIVGTMVVMIQAVVGLIGGSYITHQGWAIAVSLGIVCCMRIWEKQQTFLANGKSLPVAEQNAPVSPEPLVSRWGRPSSPR